MVLLYVLLAIVFWLVCSYAARFLTTLFFLRNQDELQKTHYDLDDYDMVAVATGFGPISLVFLAIIWTIVAIVGAIGRLQMRDPQEIAIEFAEKRKRKVE